MYPLRRQAEPAGDVNSDYQIGVGIDSHYLGR
jgi:hypothetical protein